jgi:hypothetical protein
VVGANFNIVALCTINIVKQHNSWLRCSAGWYQYGFSSSKGLNSANLAKLNHALHPVLYVLLVPSAIELSNRLKAPCIKNSDIPAPRAFISVSQTETSE